MFVIIELLSFIVLISKAKRFKDSLIALELFLTHVDGDFSKGFNSLKLDKNPINLFQRLLPSLKDHWYLLNQNHSADHYHFPPLHLPPVHPHPHPLQHLTDIHSLIAMLAQNVILNYHH